MTTSPLTAAELDYYDRHAETQAHRSRIGMRPAEIRRLVAMARRVEKLELLLMRVQFCVPVQLNPGDHQVACPVCSKLKKSGHQSTCAIAAILTPAQEATE